jgi:uncharacterized membrane protein
MDPSREAREQIFCTKQSHSSYAATSVTFLIRAYGVPILIIALAVPLVLGTIPPNGLYGFRTPKTMSSPDIWYPANRVAGWLLVAAGVATFALNFLILQFASDLPRQTTGRWMIASTIVPLLLSLGASLLYIRRL